MTMPSPHRVERELLLQVQSLLYLIESLGRHSESVRQAHRAVLHRLVSLDMTPEQPQQKQS
ncbi:hypothetical protein H6771_00865 [Candidatus Peribacteria bacterium]|nr:hypothetical protein [Candidatus Peribacteria bacterium]